MNYIKHLQGFYQRMEDDEKITTVGDASKYIKDNTQSLNTVILRPNFVSWVVFCCNFSLIIKKKNWAGKKCEWLVDFF